MTLWQRFYTTCCGRISDLWKYKTNLQICIFMWKFHFLHCGDSGSIRTKLSRLLCHLTIFVSSEKIFGWFTVSNVFIYKLSTVGKIVTFVWIWWERFLALWAENDEIWKCTHFLLNAGLRSTYFPGTMDFDFMVAAEGLNVSNALRFNWFQAE